MPSRNQQELAIYTIARGNVDAGFVPLFQTGCAQNRHAHNDPAISHELDRKVINIEKC